VEGLAVDPSFWTGRRVFVTGHTGFKGSWLTFWLKRMGAHVAGYALPPETEPALFNVLELLGPDDEIADITEASKLKERMIAFEPEVVLHLAAQALVRRSYEDPLGTFSTNVVGTVAVLDAARQTASVRALVFVSSDKCYENREWDWSYREIDSLGGHDPYSASKGAAEIVVAAMRRSYFVPHCTNGHPARIASVRAGNVIGGGDWSRDRLVPDIITQCARGGEVLIRSPRAVRPWQHVLEPVAAYLAVAQRLCGHDPGIDTSFNIGPADADIRSVLDVAEMVIDQMGSGRLILDENPQGPHEASQLRLDSAKARRQLGWRPRLCLEEAVRMTVDWYKGFQAGEDPQRLMANQIDHFTSLAPRA
jgi:CDP-glucose 4,6-dehydratase